MRRGVFLRRFWNKRSRERAEDVAASLAAAIIDGANGLAAKLEQEGFARTEPERFASDAFWLECVFCELFLRQAVIAARPRQDAAVLRQLMNGRLGLDLLRSGMSPASLDDFERTAEIRFTEYFDACRASESLQSFGALAWMRILGREEPSERATMLLALRATAELRAASRRLAAGPVSA